MKKIVYSALLAVITLSAVYAAPKKGSRIELKVWESSGTESAFIQAAIKEFRAVNPNVRILYEPVESTEARNKIELDGPAGVGADVFVAPHDHIGALVAGQHILPVEDAEEYISQFYKLAQTAAKYKDVVYGYPLGAETYALFYNKDLLTKPFKTWEEIIEFSKTWNKPVEGKYAIVWPVNDPYYSFMFTENSESPLFGVSGNDSKMHNLNAPQTLKGLRFFQSLRYKILNIPAADASRDFCNASFEESKAPMIITGSWTINQFKKLNMNFGISTLPAFPGESTPSYSFSGVRLAFVSSYSDHPAEAMEFAKFLTSKKMLEKRFAMTDQIPPRNDIEISDPVIAGISQQLKYSKPMPTISQLGTYWQVMGPAISGIWEGDNVSKTMDIVAKQMDAVK